MGGIAWTEEEDHLLKKCIQQYGEGKWHRIPHLAGLSRCRKSCRLRWLNYLRPNIKRGDFSEEEVQIIVKLHKLLGNRWTLIAGRLPGRTSNAVKNYWNCHLSKKLNALEAEERQILRNVEVFRPQPRIIDSSSVNRSQGDPSHPRGPQESGTFLPAFDVYGQSHMFELEEDNKYSCLDQQGIVGVLPMDFQFEEAKATSNGESGSQWDWGDLLFDMDLYINSFGSELSKLSKM